MKRILVIEDEPGIQMILEDNLKNEGFEVSIQGDGISGEKIALETTWDLILLDIMLPGKNGLEICQNIRKNKIDTPIIMLTARSLIMDKVTGLNLGADDYISKPFDIMELLARINALLRRENYKYVEKSYKPVVFGNFVLNTQMATLSKEEKSIKLSTREYLLLQYLLENPNKVIPRNELLDKVWGYDSIATTRTVDVHVGWLRKKLGEQKIHKHIITVRGLGYRFSLE